MIFILGGGPGLLKQPYQQLSNRRCIAVNNSYRIAPWSEAVWFGDVKWWDWHQLEVLASRIPIATCCENSKLEQWKGSHQILFYNRDRERRFGISQRDGFVSWNKSSGASAINLAYYMGARTIVLIGFDMRPVKGMKNWHDDHLEKPGLRPYFRHLKCFPAIKRDADELGLTILNATPGSAIKQFPIIDLKEVL